jgi:uncharacterized membrane protein
MNWFLTKKETVFNMFNLEGIVVVAQQLSDSLC